MLKKQHVAGGLGAAALVAVIGIVPQCWQSWLDYRKDVLAIEQSRAQGRLMDLCSKAGGKWWKGDCLEVTHGPD